MSAELEIHPDAAAASRAAAGYLAQALTDRLRREAEAALVVSGGTTPADCLECLATFGLPWQRVRVMLTDERCVAVTDPASNERMVRERLLHGAAGRARLVRLEPGRPGVALPFAAVLAGMGEDGHFASLFPDVPGLSALLDPGAPPACVPVATAASPHPRLSMNLAALLASERVVLLAFGAAKRRVIHSPEGYPVAALLQQTQTPLRVVWAP